MRSASWAVLLLASGCAFGPVRRVTVGPLQDFADVRTVRPETNALTPPPSLDLERALLDGVAGGIQRGGEGLTADKPGSFRLRLTLLDVVDGAPGRPQPLAGAASLLGLSAQTAATTGRLAFEAWLVAPDEERTLGYARYEGAGSPSLLASRAGSELGEALAKRMTLRRFERFERRVIDDRLVLIPTASTMEPGAFAITNDEVLLFRAAVGVHRRVQLTFVLGGFGVPFGGAVAIPAVHVVGAAGGGGIALWASSTWASSSACWTRAGTGPASPSRTTC
jgi:hypothetical protein